MGSANPTAGGAHSSPLARLASGGALSFVGRLASRFTMLVAQIVLARGLGPALFGLYALGATILKFASLIATAGLDKGVARFGTPLVGVDDQELSGVLGKSVSLAALLGLVFALPLWLFADAVAAHFFAKPDLASILRWFAALIPIAVLLRIFAASSRISQRMLYAVVAEDLVQPGLHLLLLAVLLPLGWGLEGALAAIAASFVVALAVSVIFLRRLFPTVAPLRLRSRLSWRQLSTFSLQSMLAATFTTLVLVADRLFLGFFRAAEEVGAYQVVSQLALLLPLISGSFTGIVAPLFADAHSRPQPDEEIAGIYRTTVRWSAYLTLPPFLLLAVCGRSVIEVTFGPAYAVATLPLTLLAAGQMVNVVTGPAGLLLLMIGRQWLWFRISGILFAMGLLLNLLLIPDHGILGAAVATAITVAGLFTAGLLAVRREFRFRLYDHRFRRLALATGTALAAVVGVERLQLGSPLATVAAAGAAAGLVFYPVLLWGALDPDELAILRQIRGRLGGARGPGAR